MCRHVSAENDIQATILTPFQEDVGDNEGVRVELLPSKMSGMGISSFAYKIARKMASSRVASKFFLSESSISRMVDSLKGGIRLMQEENRFDILHSVQPIAALACASVAKEFNMPLAVDLHNIWPEEAVAQGFIERDDDTFRRLRAVEQKIIDSASVVTVVSEFMKSYIMDNYSVSGTPIVVVPPSGPILDFPRDRNVERNVVYAGMVNAREHVDLFARSIPLVKSPASFFISRHGDAIADVKRITNSFEGSIVNYFWFESRTEVWKFLSESKVGILTSVNDITRQIGPPLKLFDYMACGLPVVANRIGGWSDMVEDEGIGLLTRDDPNDFAASIDALLTDDTTWHKTRSNAERLIREKYNWDSVAGNILVPMYERLHG